MKQSSCNETIIRLLIDHRADTSLKDNSDRTALEYAQQKGNSNTALEIERGTQRLAENKARIDNPLPCTGKVEYYVKSWREIFGIDMEGCHMDEQATYSVTVASIARMRDEEILLARHGMPRSIVILDGMACVGGDSLSFMYHFAEGQIISNEFDPVRHQFLIHNIGLVRMQLGRRSAVQRSRLGSVLDMWEVDDGNKCADVSLFRTCDALYLDPEWGGVGYRDAGSSLHMEIGGRSLDTCVTDAFRASHRLRWVVLKLPCNFDREHISRILSSDNSPRFNVEPVEKSSAAALGGLSVSSYRILLHGKEKMIFVVIERFGSVTSSGAINTPEEWRRSIPEDLNLAIKRNSYGGDAGDRKRARR